MITLLTGSERVIKNSYLKTFGLCMSLSFEDIYPLIESVPNSEKITLVGGQALNFWAELYFHGDMKFCRKHGPFTSADIDFLGNRDAVLECAGAWNGTAKLSQLSDASPNSGIIVIPLKSGDNLIIDFLISVYGIKNSELVKERMKIRYKNALLFVLSPFHCLRSRISNIIGLKRNSDYSLDRLVLAIAVMKKRITHLLDAGNIRQALKETEDVFRLACDPMLGIPLFADYGADVSEAIPQDSRMGELFIINRYPQMKIILETKRNKLKKHQIQRHNNGKSEI
ncbi:MAG: hypothetical protein GY795_42090 [Desulfobacterales bacterium]|nr:hypothetical protein [Desulfobacterales bacterium]